MRILIFALGIVLIVSAVFLACRKTSTDPVQPQKTIAYTDLGNTSNTEIDIPLNKLREFPIGDKQMAITWEEIDAYAKHDFNQEPVFNTDNFKAPTASEIMKVKKDVVMMMACGMYCGSYSVVVTGVPDGSHCGGCGSYCLSISNGSGTRRVYCSD